MESIDYRNKLIEHDYLSKREIDSLYLNKNSDWELVWDFKSAKRIPIRKMIVGYLSGMKEIPMVSEDEVENLTKKMTDENFNEGSFCFSEPFKEFAKICMGFHAIGSRIMNEILFQDFKDLEEMALVGLTQDYSKIDYGVYEAINCSKESKDFGKVHVFTANSSKIEEGKGFRNWLRSFLDKHKNKWKDDLDYRGEIFTKEEKKEEEKVKELKNFVTYSETSNRFEIATVYEMEKNGEKDHEKMELLTQLDTYLTWRRGIFTDFSHRMKSFRVNKEHFPWIKRAIEESHFKMDEKLKESMEKMEKKEVKWIEVGEEEEGGFNQVAEDFTEEIPGDLKFLFEFKNEEKEKEKGEGEKIGEDEESKKRKNETQNSENEPVKKHVK